MSNDRNRLSPSEILAVFATSAPAGDRQINGINVGRLAGQSLYVSGAATLVGPLTKELNASAGVALPNGSATRPAMRFIGDLSLGLYRSAPGVITAVSDGDPMLVVGPDSLAVPGELTTIGGTDLSLNPSGPNIDFNGKNLVNVGAITVNPNKFEFSSTAVVVTSDDTPTTIASIATVTNASYSIICQASCISTVDNTSTGAFRLFVKGKNIGGVVSVDTVATILDTILDAPINTALIDAAPSGTFIVIRAIGVAGITIRWYAGGEVVRVTLA